MPGTRVRFAPSPTGFLHVGSARSALFNWFIARQSIDGVFILRIEDTDEARNREEWVDGIVSSMQWLLMSPDEGPYRQSEFAQEHTLSLETLETAGFTYFCDCTGDDVAARKPKDAPPGYDGFCRSRGLIRGDRTAYRFRVPHEGVTTVHDDIRGNVEFSNALLDDFVIAKPSGAVLFALANVVDDRRDAITHVIRGEEHLPNTPKQILLWQALDVATDRTCPLPTYAHLPVLVNEKRKKLSKRRDPVAVEMYRDQGFLAEAFVNYLALLGWSPRGELEKVPLEECVRDFRLTDVAHSPAFFDVKKLTHLNGEYVRELPVDEFVRRCAPWTTPWSCTWSPDDVQPPWTASQFDESVFFQIAPLIQQRVGVLSEVPEMIDFLFLDDAPMNDVDFDKAVRNDPVGRDVLGRSISVLSHVEWNAARLHEATMEIGDALSLPLRKTQAPIRCAITGKLVGPPLFESLELLGRDRSIARMRDALARLGG